MNHAGIIGMSRTLWDADELPAEAGPEVNKFHTGNGEDGKHYWLTPPELYAELDAKYGFDFDPCPFPKPDDFDGLTAEWGQSNYVNPPFGSIIHEGRKKGPTAWVRKALAERAKGKRVVLVYPIDKWILMLLEAGATVTNLGDVRWLATEDGTPGQGTGRHIACFVLAPDEIGMTRREKSDAQEAHPAAVDAPDLDVERRHRQGEHEDADHDDERCALCAIAAYFRVVERDSSPAEAYQAEQGMKRILARSLPPEPPRDPEPER